VSDVFADLDRELSGAEVLDLAKATLTRYVVFPSPEAADAVTLYAAATHAADHLHTATRLVIKSPEKRCGKSRLLDVLTPLTHKPLLTANISAAALVRSVTATDPPTIMLDEADATFGKALKGDERAEALRGILNAGFTRNRPYSRWDAGTRTVEECPTFAFAVLAGIGDMPDTIEDRAVIIALRRKAPGESVARYRIRRDEPKVRAVGDQLGAWVGVHAEEIGQAEPAMPDGLNDRAEDLWEGLLAVADAAGGSWLQRARKAAIMLSGNADDDAAEAQRLLSDLRDVFGDSITLHTTTILGGLYKIEEAPWGSWYGHPLSPRDLARLLKPYGVRSRKVNIGGNSAQGYRAEDLFDAWQRYLPARNGGGNGTSGTSGTSQVSQGEDGNRETEPMEPLAPGSGGSISRISSSPGLSSQVPEVPVVPEDPPESGQAADGWSEPTTTGVTEGNCHGSASDWSALGNVAIVEEVW
jgi:hypothetical protein